MKVLVADKFEPAGIAGLKATGCSIAYEPEWAGDALANGLRATGADILVVRSTKVTAAMLADCPLSLIVRAGAGVDAIDVPAASARGIYVANCPGKNAIAVAELTMALILAIDRRIADNVVDLRAGAWNKKEYSKARGLSGQMLGLLGFGPIAQEVAARAHAFGMPIVVWSRSLAAQGRSEASLLGFSCQVAKDPCEVAERCDILSVHLALAEETRGLVNAAVLGKLKSGATLINTSRAEVVDWDALPAAIESRGLRVGLDVYPNEPSAGAGAFSSALAAHPSVVGTHHIGASTDQAQNAIALETVRIVETFVRTGKVPNLVNLAKKSPATHVLVVRHRDRPGVLAHVFDQIKSGNINVQETENVIFEGAQAAVARIHLDGAPGAELLQIIQSGNADILDVRLVAL